MSRLGSKVAVVILMLVTPLSLVQAQAGMTTGFMLGLMVGGGSSSHGVRGDSSGMLLYVMPRANERIRNPLEARVTTSPSYNSNNTLDGQTLWERFANAVSKKMADKYEILQVMQVANEGRGDGLSLWFVYIEKDKLIPIKDLPPLEKK